MPEDFRLVPVANVPEPPQFGGLPVASPIEDGFSLTPVALPRRDPSLKLRMDEQIHRFVDRETRGFFGYQPTLKVVDEDAPVVGQTVVKTGDVDLAADYLGSFQETAKFMMGLNADQAADAMRYAQLVGSGKGATPENVRDIKNLEQAKAIYEAVLPYKRLRAWMENPYRAAASRDSVAMLARIEAAVHQDHAGLVEDASKALADATLNAARGVAQSLKRGGEFLAAHKSKGRLLPVGEWARDVGAAALEIPILQRAPEAPQIEPWSARGMYYNVLGVVPQVGGAVAGTLAAGPVGGAATIVPQIFGPTVEENLAKGDSLDAAVGWGTLNAGGQMALEYVGLAKLTKFFGKALPSGLRALAARPVGAVAVEGLKAAAVEGGTEALQSIAVEKPIEALSQAFREGGSFGEAVQIYQRTLGETLKQGAYEGLMVLPFALFGVGAKMTHIYHTHKVAEFDKSLADRLVAEAQGAPLKTRAPEQVEAFVKQVLGDSTTAPTAVHFQAADLSAAYGGDAQALAADLAPAGVDEAAVVNALAHGHEVVVPLVKWAVADITPEARARLNPIERYRAQGPTNQELANTEAVTLERFKTAVAEAEQEYQKIREEVVLPPELEAQMAVAEKRVGKENARAGFSLVKHFLGAVKNWTKDAMTPEQALRFAVPGGLEVRAPEAVRVPERGVLGVPAAPAQEAAPVVRDVMEDQAAIPQQEWASSEIGAPVQQPEVTVPAGEYATALARRRVNLRALLDCVRGVA
ncbi:MAG TPA: hypothetical protein VLI39_07640 [Sedimentisphaerales bacterium]|nr:hypothetical protein [Sedimentisphaerales bacterium]